MSAKYLTNLQNFILLYYHLSKQITIYFQLLNSAYVHRIQEVQLLLTENIPFVIMLHFFEAITFKTIEICIFNVDCVFQQNKQILTFFLKKLFQIMMVKVQLPILEYLNILCPSTN